MRKFSLAAIALILVSACSGSSGTKLLETGSSLVYPLMNGWVAAYQKTHPTIQITTQSTGSGTGIAQAVSGVAQIGASDAYMSDGQLVQGKMLNIPLAISAQQINYNIPGLNTSHLNLSGPVLAGIYSGTIKMWDDAQIKALNAALAAKLPHETIIPVHRTDGSGDTFIFSQYLAFSTPSWKNGPGFGTSISWPPVPTAVGANGNPGMVQTCQNTKYSIAYIGVSFLNQTNSAGLGFAALQNRAGAFVLPTDATISAAANIMSAKTPADERISLIFAPGANSYPIVNYEYAIVNPKQANAQVASDLTTFLNWAIDPTGGNSATYLNPVHFIALPAAIVAKSRAQIASIKA